MGCCSESQGWEEATFGDWKDTTISLEPAFSGYGYIPALKAIAVADTGDVEIILHKDRILRIAEEYANAGIRELKRELVDQPGQPLWNLVNLIRDTQVD